jgi:undecaprenyl-diphosphatase
VTRRLGVALALFAIVIVLGLWIQARGTPAFDEPLVRLLGPLRGHPRIWLTVTNLGDWPARVTIGLAAAGWLWWHRARLGAGVLLATVVVQTLTNSGLKAVFARARPEVFDHLDYTWDKSFPSGHSAQNACLWLLIVLLIDRRLALIGVPVVVAIGLSRIVLGVHWPSDVIGGWALGAGFALIGSDVSRRVAGAAGGESN